MSDGNWTAVVVIIDQRLAVTTRLVHRVQCEQKQACSRRASIKRNKQNSFQHNELQKMWTSNNWLQWR